MRATRLAILCGLGLWLATGGLPVAPAAAQYHDCTENPMPLRTSGKYIVNRCGERFRIKAVNWYGASDVNMFPGGLDKQKLEDIVRLIKDFGFNAVRLPFANAMVRPARRGGTQVKLDVAFKDDRLRGKTPLEVYDAVVEALTDAGIHVILNNHTTHFSWCCNPDDNSFWYLSSLPGEEWTEAAWVEDWTWIALRYRSNPRVIGADLRNEVRTAPLGTSPNWGWDNANDWRRAAVRAGDAVLDANPDLLIFVEAINWWGGVCGLGGSRPGLVPALTNPVTLKQPRKLVYAIHNYPFTGPTSAHEAWCPGQATYATLAKQGKLRDQLDEEMGALLRSGMAPVWVSEFGAGYDDSSNETKMEWLRQLADYIIGHDLDWAWWPLNATFADGSVESFGLLKEDWSGYRDDNPRMAQVKRLIDHGEKGFYPGDRPIWRYLQVVRFTDGDDNRSAYASHDWKPGSYKGVCPDQYHAAGISKDFVLLCVLNWGFEPDPAEPVKVVDTDSTRGSDWWSGHIKYTCPDGWYVQGASQAGSFFPTLDSVLCRKMLTPYSDSSTWALTSSGKGDNRESAIGDDWALNMRKIQCRANAYLAGVGLHNNRPAGVLCGWDKRPGGL